MFEVYMFEKPRDKGDKSPHVEVRQSGRIVFNDLAFNQFINATHVQLAFDRESGLIGLKPCEANTNTLPVKKTKLRGAYLNALKFFKHYDIRPSDKMVLDLYTQDDFVVIDLNQQPTM